MEFEDIDTIYEKKKREVTSKYNLLIQIVNKIKNPKKRLIEQDKADLWYKKKLKKVKAQYGRSIRYKIEASFLRTRLKNLKLKFDQFINKSIHFFEKHLGVLSPIYNFVLQFIKVVWKFISLILYIIFFPFIKLFGKPTSYAVVTYIFPMWYKFIDYLQFSISRLKDLAKHNRPARAFDDFVTSHGTKKSAFEIKKEIEEIIHKPITEIATKSMKAIKSTDTIESVLSRMKYDEVGTLAVIDSGELVGQISEKDILKLEVRLDMLKTKVSDVMDTNVVKVEESTKIFDVIETLVSYDIRKVIVGKSPPYKIVTVHDILATLDTITKRFLIRTIYLKRINEIMNKDVVTVPKKEKATYARILMMRKNVSTLIVVDDKTSEPLGIITKRDYLMELLLGIERIRKLYVENIMKTPISQIKPHLTILEANSEMLSKNFRKEAVMDNKKVIGIIGQYEVFKEIYYFIKLTLQQIEKGQA